MIPSFPYDEQLAFLDELVRQWAGYPHVLRMLLSLAESVKGARDHQDCLKAISLNRSSE